MAVGLPPVRARTDAGTALVVVVPEAEPAVGGWRERLDPSSGRWMPAHVTVLYPWLPADFVDDDARASLAAIAAAAAPFDVRFERLGTFPGTTLYLVPEPAAPFLWLTAAVAARWPGHPPYRGAHLPPVPHLTIATGVDPSDPAVLPAHAAVAALLPVRSRAVHLSLFGRGPDGRCQRWEDYPLG